MRVNDGNEYCLIALGARTTDSSKIRPSARQRFRLLDYSSPCADDARQARDQIRAPFHPELQSLKACDGA